MNWFSRLAILAFIGGVLSSGKTPSWAGTKVHVGQPWPSNQMVSIDQINHDDWDRLLRQYVDAEGYVNYQDWKASPTDRAALQHYLADLARANPQLAASRDARLAFWINAYNAVTIEGVLQKYPTTSIRDHTAKLYGYNIWHDLLLRVGKDEISLDRIEHKVLRPMGEPRVHFAIVCASIGCPRLLNSAYLPNSLEEQLTLNTRNFFGSPRQFQFNSGRRQIELSQILKWFKSDFGATQQQQLAWMIPYLPSEQARQIASDPSVSIGYLEYDWQLNDQTNRSAVQ